MNETLALYQQSGPTTFADLLTQLAPYFSTISPEFLSLERGRCEVKVRNNPAVHNHLGTVHAIAMCNMAELAAGTMVGAPLPANMRWIPKGMQVSYL
ncbi:DUF4442 domain-containing protein, partial [bacterium]|nr:DUF4442 domain-containing protein [bacterium]